MSAYGGRRVDLAAFRLDGGLLVPLLGADGGGVVAGASKALQRCLVCLLTPRGSLAYRPGDGCSFLHDAAARPWRGAADVGQSFAAAAVDVVRQVRDLEAAADPADERLSAFTLEAAATTAAGVLLRVRARLVGGSAQTVSLLVSLTEA